MPYIPDIVMTFFTVMLLNIGLYILLHGIITLPDAMTCDRRYMYTNFTFAGYIVGIIISYHTVKPVKPVKQPLKNRQNKVLNYKW